MKINKLIDHTFLKPFGTKADIDTLLEEAITYDFKSVCINPTWVKYAAESLKKSDVLVCTVIGFPLGASTTQTKVYETKDALKNGANEIDMVLNIGWVKDGEYDQVEKEIKAVKEECQNHTLKVILETCFLEKDEIEKSARAAINAGADFVKTSTGFGSGGATVEDVKLMKDIAGKEKEVKASGGVRSLEDLEAMVEAGATRIGASSGVSIMQGKTSKENY
jgi:deoxyribose-phosphate aldolase